MQHLILYIYNESPVFNNIYDFIKILVETTKENSKIVGNNINTTITSKYKNLREPQNYLDYYEATKKEKQGIERLGYIIVGVIALIGIMNFTNSTLSGIMARRKELGMIRAIGITDNEIKETLIKEGLYQIGIALILGTILGNILAFISVYIFTNFMGATYGVYTIPFIETILCFIVVILVLIFIIKVSINRITKDSVIEQIRFED